MTKLFATLLTLMVFLFTGIPSIAAGLYKWVDADGKVTYSTQPPPPDSGPVKDEKVLNINPKDERTAEETRRIGREKQKWKSVVEQEKREKELKKAQREYERQLEDAEYERSKNIREAEELRKDAQKLYRQSASRDKMLKSQRRALQEQAQALERQADVLTGRRETLAPTQSEQMERKVRDLEDEIDSLSTPHYVPSTGKWCQQLGGVMNCW